MARLNRDFSTCDEPRHGRRKTVTTTVGFIIHEDLDKQKPSTKWDPNCLNSDQKLQRCGSSSSFWNFIVWRNRNDFLSRLVTMDKTWLYHYDPKTKQQIMDWRHSGAPGRHPQKIRVHNPSGKVLASIFWDQRAKPSTRRITHLCWSN
jgi:hypothetical protein